MRTNQKTLLTVIGRECLSFVSNKVFAREPICFGAPQSRKNNPISFKLPLMPLSRRPLNSFLVPDDNSDIMRDHIVNIHTVTPPSRFCS